MYRIAPLTAEEYATLCWLSDRGYDAGVLDAAGVLDEADDGTVTLGGIAEPDAWEIQAAVDEDPHAFLACNGSESLADKLHTFLGRIV